MSVNQNLVPIVIEKSGRTERAYDIYSRLLKDRIVFLGGQVDDTTANIIVAQMLFLSNEDTKSDIHFYINSPGGSITAGLAIYDTMQFLRCDVATYCIGQAASMAAWLLAGGHENKRFLLANNRILLHQPLIAGQLIGPATDLDIEAQEIYFPGIQAKQLRRSKRTATGISGLTRPRQSSMVSLTGCCKKRRKLSNTRKKNEKF